jgi:predicted DNA-binding transcriptional regulator YafY
MVEMMQSTTQIQRQWQILICLMSRRNGLTIKELSTEVGVDDRTIRRDLTTLRKAHFPLEERVSEYGRKHWKLVEGGTSNIPIQFNWSEAVALYLGRRLLDPLAGTNFWQSAQSAFSKIRAMLGEAALLQLDKVSHAFLQTMPGVSDYSGKAEMIDNLMLAIEDHKIAFVAYQSERSTEPVSLEMYPYGIVYHKGSLYLVAYSRDHEKQDEKQGPAPSPQGARPCLSATSVPLAPALRGEGQGEGSSTRIAERVQNGQPALALRSSPPRDKSAIRHFKLDRVTGVDVQSLQFTPDPEFNLQQHLANSFGVYQSDEHENHPQKIRIRFSSEAARYVQEKTWHASQQITKDEKDGSVVLEVHLSNTKEIKAWTLSFGPRATVLEPETLRNEIVKDIEAMLSKYQAKVSVQ